MRYFGEVVNMTVETCADKKKRRKIQKVKKKTFLSGVRLLSTGEKN